AQDLRQHPARSRFQILAAHDAAGSLIVLRASLDAEARALAFLVIERRQLAPPQMIDRAIVADAEKILLEGVDRIVARDAAHGAEHRLLQHVLARLSILDALGDVGVQSAGVLALDREPLDVVVGLQQRDVGSVLAQVPLRVDAGRGTSSTSARRRARAFRRGTGTGAARPGTNL